MRHRPPPRVREMIRHRVVLLFISLASIPTPGTQPTAPDLANLRCESGQTRKRLTEAEQKLQAGNAADGVDTLQRILDEAGDDLVSVDGKLYRPARWIAHQLLARLPANTLKGYQDRVEVPAQKLLAAGRQTRDPAPLWQLLDLYFVSRSADEAL